MTTIPSAATLPPARPPCAEGGCSTGSPSAGTPPRGIVAVAAGLAAGSVSLVGFGLDSGIEVSAAVILAWRLAQERGQGCTQAADRRATPAIAVSFVALAAYVGIESTRDLLGRVEPEASLPGIILATLSLVVMPVLARAKRKVAPVLGSRAAASEATRPRCAHGCRRSCWSGWPPTPRLAGGGPTRPPAWHRRPGRHRRRADLAGRIADRHLLRRTSRAGHPRLAWAATITPVVAPGCPG